MSVSPVKKSTTVSPTRNSSLTRWVLIVLAPLIVVAIIWAVKTREVDYQPLQDISKEPSAGEYRPFDPGKAVAETADSPEMKKLRENLERRRRNEP